MGSRIFSRVGIWRRLGGQIATKKAQIKTSVSENIMLYSVHLHIRVSRFSQIKKKAAYYNCCILEILRLIYTNTLKKKIISDIGTIGTPYRVGQTFSSKDGNVLAFFIKECRVLLRSL